MDIYILIPAAERRFDYSGSGIRGTGDRRCYCCCCMLEAPDSIQRTKLSAVDLARATCLTDGRGRVCPLCGVRVSIVVFSVKPCFAILPPGGSSVLLGGHNWLFVVSSF